MFSQFRVRPYIRYSLIGTVVYCIPTLMFILRGSYTDAWLLYLGNALFMAAIAYFMLTFNGNRDDNASSTSMLLAGHITAVMSIIMTCVVCFVLLALLIPGFFNPSGAEKVLTDSPASNVHGNTNGMSFMIFMNAIFGNISAGSFISVLLAFTVKRDQTKESTSFKHRSL